MKYLIVLISSLLAACASKSTNPSVSELQYDNILQLHVGETSASDVANLFGVPSNRVERNGYYILNYNSLRNGCQRMSLNFNSANDKLSSLLWIPAEDEKEISIEGAKSKFKDANFKKTESDNSSPHAISRIVLYTDEKTGITIRYNPSSKVVEAIAKYDVSSRAPAATHQKEHAPYTFGDELKTSR